MNQENKDELVERLTEKLTETYTQSLTKIVESFNKMLIRVGAFFVSVVITLAIVFGIFIHSYFYADYTDTIKVDTSNKNINMNANSDKDSTHKNCENDSIDLYKYYRGER